MKALTTTVVMILLSCPICIGTVTFCDPVFRSANNNYIWADVGRVDLIPDDGIPRKVVINARRADSWNRSAAEPIGEVFLRHETGTQDISAFAAACPSNGVTLQLDKDNRVYRDPCHGNEFALDGKRLGRNSSPRDMDALEVRIKNGVLSIKYQAFSSGRREKAPRNLDPPFGRQI